jgi:hypothetical protein
MQLLTKKGLINISGRGNGYVIALPKILSLVKYTSPFVMLRIEPIYKFFVNTLQFKGLFTKAT